MEETELREIILQIGLKDPTVELEVAPNGRIGGYIISDSFEELPQLERQRKIWDFLKQSLDRDKQLGIISLLTLTPAEAGLAD